MSTEHDGATNAIKIQTRTEKGYTMKQTVEKTANAVTYEPVTVETLEQTARAAAYVAIRKAYLSTARKVTDSAGNVLDYDGNSGGADIIRRLYNGFGDSVSAARSNMDAAAAAYDAAPDRKAAATAETAALAYAETTGNDTDDCIQAAALALWENIAANGGEVGTESAFMDAVRAVHRHIYQQDKNTSTRVRRRYDSTGQLLEMGDYQYIKYPHIYIDAYNGTDENGGAAFDIVDVNDELSRYMRGQSDNDTINDVLAILTTRQRNLVHMVAKGYTFETIAEKLYNTEIKLAENGTDKTPPISHAAAVKRAAALARKHMERIRKRAAVVER